MADFRTTKKGADSPLLDFIMKYFPVLIGLLVATPYLLEWIAKIGSNIRAADTAAEIKDKETKAASVVKTAAIKAEQSAKENASANVKVLQTKSDLVLKGYTQATKDRLSNAAQMLAHNLGTRADLSIFNPATWTENDSDVSKLLTDNYYYIKVIEQLYQGVYTKNNNLKNDVLSHLDSSDFARVKAYYKSKKSTYFG